MPDLVGGTIVTYTGSMTDHHGLAVLAGPSGDYPPGEEVRYTLLFADRPRLVGVGAASFAPVPSGQAVPEDVVALADAVYRNAMRQAMKDRVLASLSDPERDAPLRDLRAAMREARLREVRRQREAMREFRNGDGGDDI